MDVSVFVFVFVCVLNALQMATGRDVDSKLAAVLAG